jgi:hypothetical protein
MHADDRSMNSDRATRRPHTRDLATVCKQGPCLQRCQSAARPDSGNRQNRSLFADNSDTVPASILFHETG